MDMNQRKLAQAEETYLTTQKQLERQLDDISDEKRKFQYYLENLSEQLRFSSSHYDVKPDQRAFYRLLSDSQEEAEYRTKKERVRLEDGLEENQAIYSKEVQRYEEFRREERKHGDA